MSSIMQPMVLCLIAAVSIVTFAFGVWVGSILSREKDAADIVGGTSDPRKKSASRTGKEVELYVGNLPYDTGEKDLEKVFGEFGAVASVRIIRNRVTGKSKGFGFVEMADSRGSAKAVDAMDEHELKGRKLVVNEAKSRTRDDE